MKPNVEGLLEQCLGPLEPYKSNVQVLWSHIKAMQVFWSHI